MVADLVYYDYRRYSRNRFEMERDRQDLFGTSSHEIIAKRLPRLESFTQGAPESLFLLSRQ